MSAVAALEVARAVGIELRVDGGDLLLEASAAPPPAVLDLLKRHKAEIIAVLGSGARLVQGIGLRLQRADADICARAASAASARRPRPVDPQLPVAARSAAVLEEAMHDEMEEACRRAGNRRSVARRSERIS